MSKPDLLPCPFCGPQADPVRGPSLLEVTDMTHDFVMGYTVMCPLCGIEKNEEYKRVVVREWNTRDGVKPPEEDE